MQLLVNSIVSKPALLKDFYQFRIADVDKEREAKELKDKQQQQQQQAGGIVITSPEGHTAGTMTPIEDFIVNVTLAHYEQRVRKAASANFHHLCSQ
jgi:hypothetical protein